MSGEFRMGLEGHLSRNTLGWATVGVQAGKSGYHNETAQIGLRYMFLMSKKNRGSFASPACKTLHLTEFLIHENTKKYIEISCGLLLLL